MSCISCPGLGSSFSPSFSSAPVHYFPTSKRFHSPEIRNLCCFLLFTPSLATSLLYVHRCRAYTCSNLCMPLNRLLTLVPDVRFVSQASAHYPKDTRLHLLGLRHCSSSNREFLVLRSRLYHLWPCSNIQGSTCPSILPHLPKIVQSHVKSTCSWSYSLEQEILM